MKDIDKKRNKQCKFTINQEQEIIRQYQEQKLSLSFIAKKYQCNTTTIQNILKAYDIPRRTLSEARRNFLNYTINENSFSDLDDRETCYWLGAMYTDGFISCTNKYTDFFGISVQSKDEKWLIKFKNYLQYNGELHRYRVGESGYKPGTEYVRLLVGNSKIVENLKKVGVIEHKTKLIDSIPSVKYMDDFIRGVVDGDGSLRKAYPNIRICGNKKFLIAIGDYLKLPYKIIPDKSIFDLTYNIPQSKELERRLYQNAPIYLERKYQIAKRSFL